MIVKYKTYGYEMTAMGASPKSPKVSHTYEEILVRFGRASEIPEEYEPPPSCTYLWSLFWHLSHRRKSGDGNSFAIEYAEVFAYMQCLGEVLAPLEIDIIMAMDDAFRKQLADTREHQRNFGKSSEEGAQGRGKPRGKKF